MPTDKIPLRVKDRTPRTKSRTPRVKGTTPRDRLIAWHRAIGWHPDLAQDLRDGRALLDKQLERDAPRLSRLQDMWAAIGDPEYFDRAQDMAGDDELMADLYLARDESDQMAKGYGAHVKRGADDEDDRYTMSAGGIHPGVTDNELVDFATAVRAYEQPRNRLMSILYDHISRRYSTLWESVPTPPLMIDTLICAILAGDWAAAAKRLLAPFDEWGPSTVLTYAGRLPDREMPASYYFHSKWPEDAPDFDLDEALGFDDKGNDFAAYWAEAAKHCPSTAIVLHFHYDTKPEEIQEALARALTGYAATMWRKFAVGPGHPINIQQRMALYRLRWEWVRMREKRGMPVSDSEFCSAIYRETKYLPEDVMQALAPDLKWFLRLAYRNRRARLEDEHFQALKPDPTVPPVADFVERARIDERQWLKNHSLRLYFAQES